MNQGIFVLTIVRRMHLKISLFGWETRFLPQNWTPTINEIDCK